jgi:hypothetical protein
MHFSTRLQRFAYARLLASYLTGSGPAFSSTLTTIALYDSSLRWFEARSCKLASRGLSLISCAAWLLWKCLTHSSSFAPSWRTFVQMPNCVGLGSSFAQIRPGMSSYFRRHGSHRTQPRSKAGASSLGRSGSRPPRHRSRPRRLQSVIFSLHLHSAPCITVKRSTKCGGALP